MYIYNWDLYDMQRVDLTGKLPRLAGVEVDVDQGPWGDPLVGHLLAQVEGHQLLVAGVEPEARRQCRVHPSQPHHILERNQQMIFSPKYYGRVIFFSRSFSSSLSRNSLLNIERSIATLDGTKPFFSSARGN
jgi:hypothetical protein